MTTAQCDSKGRLYLKEALRTRYGEKFIIVETPKSVLLLPVPKDPIKDLSEIGKALKGRSLKDLKKHIRQSAVKEVGK